jgi:hypothetical protein
MRETELRGIIRRAVQASLALGTACSNGSSGVPDASGDSVAFGADAALDARPVSDTGASLDAAARDAGNPCRPAGFDQVASCVSAVIPGTCFDADTLGPEAATTPVACSTLCGGSRASCDVERNDGGSALVCYSAACSNGRRPPGLSTGRSRGPLLGRYFAEVAGREAASVDAFEILRRELANLGAPVRLLRAASRARADEVRHARLAASLARRHGGRPASFRVRRVALRSLERVAIENAVEGCVRETFGAAVAMYQAAAANDANVRHVMSSLANDEIRHAVLSWDVAAWAQKELSPESCARLCDVQGDAVSSLRQELDREVPTELALRAGVPRRAAAIHLFDALAASLWRS